MGVRSDADPGVGNLEAQPSPGLGVDQQADLAPLGELDRIAGQVGEDLAQAPGISHHPAWRQGRHVEPDAQSFPRRLDRHHAMNLAQQRVQVKAVPLDRHLADLHARKVEEPVDQAE